MIRNFPVIQTSPIAEFAHVIGNAADPERSLEIRMKKMKTLPLNQFMQVDPPLSAGYHWR
jgi:hypothetical protein